jgi:mono/diheme cytochrome c family protein
MRYFLTGFFVLVLAVVAVAGFRGEKSTKPPIELFPDMDRQPKLRPQVPNGFFANGMSSQLPVPGTVARGAAYEDNPMNTGKETGTTNFVEHLPVKITAELLARGQQRYQINCAPCHSAVGDGKGITSKYGILNAVSLHDPRIVKMADGEIFNTITHGKNTMGAYGANVVINDRWAIIAYVRALQRSRLGDLADVPADQQAALKK